jgi:glycosyltransferase involved in cell wall biosynthesis
VKISAAIITLNEEENIRPALDSVSWADEIVVVDSGSKDKTKEIAREMGARVIEHEWLGFGRQKQLAVENCSHDWIFSLDADETVSAELRVEIESLKSKPSSMLADGYLVPRKSIYMDREIRHSGWYPDNQLRFFRKTSGKWQDRLVHETFEVEEGLKTAKLDGEIGHVSVKSVREHMEMITDRYAPLGALQMERDGKSTSIGRVVFAAPFAFLRTYLLKLGLLDGFPGFCIAMFSGYNVFLKNLLLYEKQNRTQTDNLD